MPEYKYTYDPSTLSYKKVKLTFKEKLARFLTYFFAIVAVASLMNIGYNSFDMKTDLRSMNDDIRHITKIVNDIEDRQKEDTREIFEELKIIEDDLNLNINKALNNPLNNMSATK